MESASASAEGPGELGDARPSLLRAALGGVLMGLANLVPGISGGTMLLAAGVYHAFVDGVAELTTLRLRRDSLLTLAAIGGSAAVAILLLAGPTRMLVVEHRWAMYSLFIGLTLGGVPLVLRLARPVDGAFLGAAAATAAGMVLLGLGQPAESTQASLPLLLLAGLAGASAMVLPGISGGYLLLLLGQYVPILGAIDRVKQALLGSGGPDLGALFSAAGTLVPVALGAAVGIAGVSNALRWLLHHHPRPTLGALLGLLLGSVAGLWPFSRPVESATAAPAEVRVLGTHEAARGDPGHRPLTRTLPGPGEAAGSVLLILLGLGITRAIDRVGGRSDPPA